MKEILARSVSHVRLRVHAEDEQQHGAVYRALQEEMEEDYGVLPNERVDSLSRAAGTLYVQCYREECAVEYTWF